MELQIQDLYKMSTGQLYKAYLDFMNDFEELEKDYQDIRHGIKIKFDIYDIIEDYVKYHPLKGFVTIRKLRVELDQYREEIELRTMKMLNNLRIALTSKEHHTQKME